MNIIGTKKTITFRQDKSKNNQITGINLVEDYLFDKTLCVETLHDEPKE